MHRQPLEKAETMLEGGRRAERGEERAGPGTQYVSGQKRHVPAEAFEGVVKRIELARPDFLAWPSPNGVAARMESTDGRNTEHGCSWSGFGWHSSAARIAVLFRLERAQEDVLSQGEARRKALARSSRWAEAKRYARRERASFPKGINDSDRAPARKGKGHGRRRTTIGVSGFRLGAPHRVSKRRP